jgi:hypothetical protein
VIMIGCGHCSVPDEWSISIDLGRSPPMPPQSSVNRAMTVSGPPSASTPREHEESGGSYEDRNEQPDWQPALMPDGAVAVVRPESTYLVVTDAEGVQAVSLGGEISLLCHTHAYPSRSSFIPPAMTLCAIRVKIVR